MMSAETWHEKGNAPDSYLVLQRTKHEYIFGIQIQNMDQSDWGMMCPSLNRTYYHMPNLPLYLHYMYIHILFICMLLRPGINIVGLLWSVSAVRELPKLAANGSNYLYTTEYNYVDFNVDDNGLWVIYTATDSNNTIVAKVMLRDFNTTIYIYILYTD